MVDLFKKNLIEILDNMKKFNVDKNLILKNIDDFDLIEKNITFPNPLCFIIKNNKTKKLGFNKEDILNILDRFDLSLVDNQGCNILMCMMLFNESQKLNFTKEDILNILDKFDLKQRNKYGFSIYDFIENYHKIERFSKNPLSTLISKLDIEMTDKDNNIILIKELKNGLFFDSEELFQRILNTKNKDILDCVYKHIEQIAWTQKDLLIFFEQKPFNY